MRWPGKVKPKTESKALAVHTDILATCAEVIGAKLPDDAGEESGDQACEQAGQAFNVRLRVSPTPNPSFRRVDAQVFAGASPLVRLSTVLGRY